MWYTEMLQSFGLICAIGIALAIGLGFVARILKE